MPLLAKFTHASVFKMVGTICVACALSFAMAQDAPSTTKWSDPSLLTARLMNERFVIKGGETLATYNGRTIEVNELFVGGKPIDHLFVWFSRQNFLVKGRSTGSRLRSTASSYGFRYAFNEPSEDERAGWAFQYEAVKPGDSTSTVINPGGSSSVTYSPTKNDVLTVIRDDINGESYWLSYAMVKLGAGAGSADVYTLGYGRDLQWGAKTSVRLQANAIAQRWSGPATNNVFEIKPVFSATLEHRLGGGLSFEAEGTLLPTGMPMAYGRLTGLSSFLLYEPGGAADGLRKDFLGFATFRLVYKGSF